MSWEQISFIGKAVAKEDVSKLERNKKRNWENAFQKWSDEHGMQMDSTKSWGACGYGSMCDWCEDNSYGRPCIRALNTMCREKGRRIDYDKRDNFEEVWDGADMRGDNDV